ncbi:uncharacterized protein LOC126669930 [Mercurialis annua]|uniref:uncharacterized protein LOC126669930 n=1 Tax=Mercurialis annua TaxID=3986 RepID=UPI0024ADE16E|nr:uncharacterized protein LOC126669930 [Mercurialis annua]
MTTNELPALKIYWDGTILSTPGGVDYVSGKSELVELTSVVNFAQLQVVIRRVIGLKDGDEIVKIYLRVPRFDEHGRFQKYDGFPMETDVHMQAIQWMRKKGRPVESRRRNEMDQTFRDRRNSNYCRRCLTYAMAAAHDHMQPGPERPALLFLQHDHISQDVWDGTVTYVCILFFVNSYVCGTTGSHYIRVWDDRLRFVISGQPLQDPPHYHSEYMDWFRYVTRRWITRQGAELGAQADFVERVRRDAPVDTELRRFAASTQRGTREDRRDVTSPPIEPSIPPHRLPVIPDALIDPTTLRHRRRERRHPPAPPQRPTDPMPLPVVFHPFRGHYYYAGSSSAPPPFSSGPPSSSGQFYGDSAHHYFQGSCSYPVPPGPSSPFVPPPPAYVPPTVPPFQV